jgi:V/A-type H+-transporting ATPase subunit E
MPANIESFVKTLESEGVEAGKRAADRIKAKAREQATDIVAEAKKQAEQIISDAQSEADKVKTRMNSSLELATRDAIFQLREKLAEQLRILLELNVEKALNDEETLSHVLREVIPLYAKADAEGTIVTEINVSQNLKSRVLESALRELSHSLKDQNVQVNAKHNLAKSGFEYKVEGSTVEVSTESVSALLSEMIDPELQQFLEKAAQVEAGTT